MRSVLQDLRYGVAVLTKHTGATTTVIVSLALAIGLNAAFFSFANAFLYRPVQLGKVDRLAAVATRWDSQAEYSHSSYPDFRDLRDRHPLFEDVAANFYTAVGIQTDAGPQVVLAQLASASYFDVMGVRPIHGRGFRPEEDVLPEGQPVAVIEFGVRAALGAQPSEVAALVFRQGALLMAIGSAIGLIVSLGVGRLAAGLFYQVRPFEPIVCAAVLPILVLCGAAACYGPARRAARLDPMRALRCE